jgi:hypothetical protein
MKITISFLFAILTGLYFLNCSGGNQRESSSSDTTQQKTQSESVDYHSVDGFFKGNHSLALINNITKDPQDTGYICILDTGVLSRANFYFQQSDGFLNALLPMTKIRISFLADTSKDAPYCKFRWGPQDFKESEWVNNVVYAVVCVKPNQIYRK